MDIQHWRDRIPSDGSDSDIHRILTDWAFDRLSLLMQILALQETARQSVWQKIPALDPDGVALPFRYDVSEEAQLR